MLIYIIQLKKWNATYNLTAINNIKDIIEYHIIDSLQVTPYLKGFKEILDVGTGAGLPGIVLAINNPDIKLTLIDKSKKKISFLKHVCYELNLSTDKIRCIHERINPNQKLHNNDNTFDAIISRAVTQIEPFVNLTKTLLKDNGHIFLMKAKKEIIETETEFFINNSSTSKYKWSLNSIQLPKLINGEQRHLIEIYKNKSK